MSEHVRLFVSFPEELVDRPMIYEVVKRFDVVPNIRRANVEQHSGWVIPPADCPCGHVASVCGSLRYTPTPLGPGKVVGS